MASEATASSTGNHSPLLSTSPGLPANEWFVGHAVAEIAQRLAGAIAWRDGSEVNTLIAELAAVIPNLLCQAEFIVVRDIVRRVGHQLDATVHTGVGEQLMSIATAADCPTSLRRQLEAWLSGRPGYECFANPADWRIAAVLARMEARFSDSRFSLDEAARHVGLSRWHLERLLRIRTGKSFTCHVLEVRLRHAQMLLRDRSRSVKEVAYSSGFGSLRNFDRQFRRIHGVPPSGWRSC